MTEEGGDNVPDNYPYPHRKEKHSKHEVEYIYKPVEVCMWVIFGYLFSASEIKE